MSVCNVLTSLPLTQSSAPPALRSNFRSGSPIHSSYTFRMDVEKATAGTHASQGATANPEATPKHLDLRIVVEVSLPEGITRRERESTRLRAYPLDTPRMNVIQCPSTVLTR